MNKRILRINSLIRDELSNILLREVEFPDGVLATITRVEVSDDLFNASVYISVLPRDPRNHTVCGEQYIYNSNGTDYKLIAHQPEECLVVKAKYPNLLDPMRDCWAYGYWTEGAKNW